MKELQYHSNEYLKELIGLVKQQFPEAGKSELELARIVSTFYSPCGATPRSLS